MNPEKIHYRYLTPSIDPWVRQPVVSGLNKYVHEIIAIINNKYDGYLHEAAEGLGIPFEAIEEALTYYGVNYLEINKDRYRLRIRNNLMMKLNTSKSEEVNQWLRSTLDDGMSPVARLNGNNLDLARLEQHVNSMPVRSKKNRTRTTQ